MESSSSTTTTTSSSNNAAPDKGRTLGMTSAISLAGPKNQDNIKTAELEADLREAGMFESDEELQHRRWMDPTMTSDRSGTNPPSSLVEDHLTSVLFSVENINNDPFEQKVSDFLYIKYLIDRKSTRMVRTGGLFDDCPTMETEYFYIMALPHDYDVENAEGENESVASGKEKKCDSEEEEDIEYGGVKDYGGFWMLFFSTSIIDDMWKQACRLLWDGRLEGVELITVATSRPNPRASDSDDDKSVMLFYCEPWNDETFMQCLGHHIAILMGYFSCSKYLCYKSNRMAARGTRATGNLYNSLIRIPVPSDFLDALERKKRLHRILSKPKLYQQWLMDQKVDYRDETGRFYSVRFSNERSMKNVPQYSYNSGS